MSFSRFRRRRYLVDWALQGALIGHAVAGGVFVLLAVCLGVFYPLLWSFEDTPIDGVDAEPSIVLLYLHEHFWWAAGACLLLVLVGAVRFSHRVAGPMVRFKRNLRLLGRGQLPGALRTRRSDFLKHEVDCLNHAVAGIGERVDAIRMAQLAVRRRLSDCIATTFDESPELEQLVTACEDLEKAVLAFRHVDTGDEQRRQATQVALVEQAPGVSGA